MIELIETAKINAWANEQFRTHLKEKFDELKDKETPYGSFGELVYHIPISIYFWFKRMGIFDFEMKQYAQLESIQELLDNWEMIDQKYVEYLNSVKDDSISLSYTTSKGKEFSIPLKNLVIQLNNHSYHHRGHIGYFARLNGIFLPSTDALVYYRTFG